MDIKAKTRLRNLLTVYRNDVCEEAQEVAMEFDKISKCEICDFSMSDGTCIADKILLQLENELWEG